MGQPKLYWNAIGMESAKKRYSTYFINCHDLLLNLKRAHLENRLETRLKHYAKYRVLIIDEIGYLTISKEEANMFFQLINKRYERNCTIVTTNKEFSKWPDIFGDATIASAILDRLLHHSTVEKITGRSYRTKNKIQSVKKIISKTVKSYICKIVKFYIDINKSR